MPARRRRRLTCYSRKGRRRETGPSAFTSSTTIPVSCGSPTVEGGWVDARGMFLAAVGAGPVYRLLGKKDLGTTEFPPMETPLVNGEVAFRQHSGGHNTGPNWPTFLTFASRY